MVEGGCCARDVVNRLPVDPVQQAAAVLGVPAQVGADAFEVLCLAPVRRYSSCRAGATFVRCWTACPDAFGAPFGRRVVEVARLASPLGTADAFCPWRSPFRHPLRAAAGMVEGPPWVV